MNPVKKAPSVTTISLFTYGTLRTNQPESSMFRKRLIESAPAKIVGKLYQIKEGYPILYAPPETIVAKASKNLLGDWQNNLEKGLYPRPRFVSPFKWIEGELLTFPLENGILDSMDAWEGFSPGKNTFYQRVLTQAYTMDGSPYRCWAYICLNEPEYPTVPLDGTSWVRPIGLKY